MIRSARRIGRNNNTQRSSFISIYFETKIFVHTKRQIFIVCMCVQSLVCSVIIFAFIIIVCFRFYSDVCCCLFCTTPFPVVPHIYANSFLLCDNKKRICMFIRYQWNCVIYGDIREKPLCIVYTSFKIVVNISPLTASRIYRDLLSEHWTHRLLL